MTDSASPVRLTLRKSGSRNNNWYFVERVCDGQPNKVCLEGPANAMLAVADAIEVRSLRQTGEWRWCGVSVIDDRVTLYNGCANRDRPSTEVTLEEADDLALKIRALLGADVQEPRPRTTVHAVFEVHGDGDGVTAFTFVGVAWSDESANKLVQARKAAVTSAKGGALFVGTRETLWERLSGVKPEGGRRSWVSGHWGFVIETVEVT